MLIKWIQRVLLFPICLASLSADVSEFFKKASNKIANPGVRNIDFIYVINLDQRPEKFAHCIRELEPYGISPYRFSAVNGWELSLEAIDQLGVRLDKKMREDHWGTYYPLNGTGDPQHELAHRVGQTYFCHCMSRGAIGIVLSHLSVLQDAYDSGYETIWVMEDDIQVIQNPHNLSDLIDELDATVGGKKWDILFTDRDTKNQKGEYVPCRAYAWRPNFSPPHPEIFQKRESVGKTFQKIGARYGAYSMIVRRSGMKKLLDFIKEYKIFLPYDMEYGFPPQMNLYSVLEDVVSTVPNAPSDNGGANYFH